MNNRENCKNEKYLITGSAGFIGFFVTKGLLEEGCDVVGIDNMNDYYDVQLKRDRLGQLMSFKNYKFLKCDISNDDSIIKAFADHRPSVVINLAAQAGVRYSIDNPKAYIKSNVVGFFNILEACRRYPVNHLIYASSSSVYGGNKVIPFSTSHNVDHPVSLYAATKKTNELMAHTYSHLYGIPTTGLRFFTVYGPWGRPDMAYFSFTKAIFEGHTIKVYNHGDMERDFTYIDDIVEAMYKLTPPVHNDQWDETTGDLSSSFAPYKIYNIGNSQPSELKRFIHILEDKIGKKAVIDYMDMQIGDVVRTYADVSDLERDIGFKPDTKLEDGLGRFVDWFRDYYL